MSEGPVTPASPGTTAQNPAADGAAPYERLRESVGPLGTAVIAMANTAPTLSIGIGLGLISLDTGAAVPAMVLIAVLPILGIALAFSRLNRSERNLGASYSWVGRSLSPWLGFQCGWVNLAGTTIYLAYGSQVCGSIFLMLGMFLLAAFGFERYFDLGAMGANGSQLLPYLGTHIARQPLAVLPPPAMLFSSIASLQTGVLPMARGAVAMGRDGTLGPVWTRLSRRYKTPALGSLLIAGAAALIAVLGIGIGTLNQFVLAMATSVGILVSGYYGLAGLACARRFRGELRDGVWPALRSVVLPGLSALTLLGLGGFLAVSFWTSSPGFAFNAQNGRFLAAVPGCVVAAGVAVSAWVKWGRKSAYLAGRGSVGALDDEADESAGASGGPAEFTAQAALAAD